MTKFFKLTIGEVKKLLKSGTLFVMVAVLSVIIGLFSWLYATNDTLSTMGGLNAIIDMILGGAQIDAFDMLDAATGDFEIDGVQVSLDESMRQLVLELLDNETKIRFLKESPTSMSISLNPLIAYLRAHPDIITNDISNHETLKFIVTDPDIHEVIYDALAGKNFAQTLDKVIASQKTYAIQQALNADRAALLASISATAAGIIDGSIMSIEDYTVSYLYSTVVVPSDFHKDIRNRYTSVLNSSRSAINNVKYELNYFKNSNFTTSYIDLIADEIGYLGDAFVKFCDTVDAYFALPVGSSTSVLNSYYDKMINGYNSLASQYSKVVNYYLSTSDTHTNFLFFYSDGFLGRPEELTFFRREFDAFNNIIRGASQTVSTLNSVNSEYSLLVNTFPEHRDQFTNEKYSTEMRDAFTGACLALKNGALSTSGLFRNFAEGRHSVDATSQDKLGFLITNLRKSFTAVITEDVYNEFFSVAEGEFDELDALYDQINDPTLSYEELRTAYKSYVSKQQTYSSLVSSVCKLQVIEKHNLRDSQISNIYGMILTTKYALRSNVTKALFYIVNGEVAADFGSATGLVNGFGFMEFSFIIVSVLVLIFAIVISAGMIAGEHSDGTMKLLLIRPYTRAQVLFAKILATLIIAFAFLVFAFLLTYVIGGIFWGFEASKILTIFNATDTLIMNSFTIMLLNYACLFVEIIVYVLVAITISTVFKSRAGAVSISMLVYFAAMILTTLLGRYTWYKYVIFNNANLFAYFSSGPQLNDMTFYFSALITAIYCIALSFLSFLTFAKRDAT